MPTIRGLHILVVDDEPILADTFSLILTKRGFEAEAAYSGEAALEMAAERKPDVLFSDVIMGGMTGIDLAFHILTIWPCCEIILCSGLASTTELLNAAKERGCHFEILRKPVHPRTLLDHLALGVARVPKITIVDYLTDQFRETSFPPLQTASSVAASRPDPKRHSNSPVRST